MRMLSLVAASALALTASAAIAQTDAAPSITFYSLPAYLGQSVTITADTPDLAAQTFARKAQSARVTGEWSVCNTVDYGGTCRTITANAPYLARASVVSARPVRAAGSTATPASGTTAGAAVDIEALDVTEGATGQDVAFYALPSLGTNQVSAGTNDRAAADAFCKAAGATSAAYYGRARVQTSNLIDLTARTRVRGFALRDVLCKR